MLPPRYIFFIAVSLATIAVILLALLSPPVSHTTKNSTKPWLDLSMYIQQQQQQYQHVPSTEDQASSLGGAFMYHGFLTEGPENTSRVVGKAQGFIIIIPTTNNVEQFQQYYYYDSSAFNVMYLTFDTPEHSGSLSVQAKEVLPQNSSNNNNNKGRRREELRIVGGTGSFAFARGTAVISQTGGGQSSHENSVAASYHVKLQLEFPKHSSNKFLP